MSSALVHEVRAGIDDIRRMPGLVITTSVLVAVATWLALLAPILSEGTEIGTVAIGAGSEVVVELAADLDSAAIAQVEGILAALPGVELMRPSTAGDLSSSLFGVTPDQDLSGFRTIVMDGSQAQLDIVRDAAQLHGVNRAEPGVGDRADRVATMLRTLIPWIAPIFYVFGLILIANLAFAVARTRREEAHVMRLVGASWGYIWASLGTAVLVPIAAGVVVTTLAVTVLWDRILDVLPRSAAVPASSLLGSGLRIAVISAVIALAMVRIGVGITVRDRRPALID